MKAHKIAIAHYEDNAFSHGGSRVRKSLRISTLIRRRAKKLEARVHLASFRGVE